MQRGLSKMASIFIGEYYLKDNFIQLYRCIMLFNVESKYETISYYNLHKRSSKSSTILQDHGMCNPMRFMSESYVFHSNCDLHAIDIMRLFVYIKLYIKPKTAERQIKFYSLFSIEPKCGQAL